MLSCKTNTAVQKTHSWIGRQKEAIIFCLWHCLVPALPSPWRRALSAPIGMPVWPLHATLASSLSPLSESRAAFIDFTAWLAHCVALVAMEANLQAESSLCVHNTGAVRQIIHAQCTSLYANTRVQPGNSTKNGLWLMRGVQSRCGGFAWKILRLWKLFLGDWQHFWGDTTASFVSHASVADGVQFCWTEG